MNHHKCHQGLRQSSATILACALLIPGAYGIQWYQWNTGTGANEHWYGLTEDLKPWSDTRTDALAAFPGFPTDLVSIGSFEEQVFLHQTFRTAEGLWIGLTDEQQEGVFLWSDGTPLTFTNWAPPAEPNNSGNEDYVLMNWNVGSTLGKWNDLPGLPDWRYRGIVERVGGPAQPVPDTGPGVVSLAAIVVMFAACGGGLRAFQQIR